MPVPKKKTTRSARNQRRSHHALKGVMFSICPKCKEPVLPYHVCHPCGTYAGRQAIEIKAKEPKKGKKEKEKKKEKKS